MRVNLASDREEEARLGTWRVSEKRMTRAVTTTVTVAAAGPVGNVLTCQPGARRLSAIGSAAPQVPLSPRLCSR